jgi:cob(I)alamin adenosyltransferase
VVQLTSIVTRGGDLGKTSLGDGKRLLKSSLRIEAIGAVDEANSMIGLALSTGQTELTMDLLKIQNYLFDVGADLCMPDLSQPNGLRITTAYVEELEALVDLYNPRLSPLTSFVLPGGTSLYAHIHLARTIVRRAERSIVALSTEESVNPELIRYVNRLSDVLFVMARIANNDGRLDVLWRPGRVAA